MMWFQPTRARDMFDHAAVWKALDALAAKNNLSVSGLARRAGLDPTSFNKSKRVSADGRQRWPSTESLAKVLDATGATFDDFAELVSGVSTGKGNSRNVPLATVPLIGFAQAGAGGYFDDAGFPVGEGWDMVEFPSAPNVQGGCYALEVQGESMMPLYRDGDILIIQPDAPVRRGDRVVVKTRDGEVMCKTLQRHTARSIDLLSINTDHPPRHFELSDVEWIARVIWASQ